MYRRLEESKCGTYFQNGNKSGPCNYSPVKCNFHLYKNKVTNANARGSVMSVKHSPLLRNCSASGSILQTTWKSLVRSGCVEHCCTSLRDDTYPSPLYECAGPGSVHSLHLSPSFGKPIIWRQSLSSLDSRYCTSAWLWHGLYKLEKVSYSLPATMYWVSSS